MSDVNRDALARIWPDWFAPAWHLTAGNQWRGAKRSWTGCYAPSNKHSGEFRCRP